MRRSTRFLSAFMEGWSKSHQPMPRPTHHSPNLVVPSVSRDAAVISADDKTFFDDRGYFTTAGPMLQEPDMAVIRDAMAAAFRGDIDTHAAPYEYDAWHRVVGIAHKEGTLKKEKPTPDTKKQVIKINNSWWVSQQIRALLQAPFDGSVPSTCNVNRKTITFGHAIGQMAADLLGVDEIRLWHDQAIVKPGGGADVASIGWHQDYAYWQISDSTQMITALIMLQDTNTENGALMTIERSHKWGLRYDSGDPGFFSHDMEGQKKRFEKLSEGKEWSTVDNIVKGGQVSFHHCLTFHGSGPNFTDTPRYAVALHMQAGSCKMQCGKGHHHNLRDLGPYAVEGAPFNGPYFPVLFRRNAEDDVPGPLPPF